MALKLGTNNIALPYSKAYLGNKLIYKKITEVLHTDNPIPTTLKEWTDVSPTEYYNGDYRITAKNYWDTSKYLPKAFDDNPDSYYRSNSSKSGQWVKFELPTALKVTKMFITCDFNRGDPISGTVYGSNDDISWGNLGTFSDIEKFQELVLSNPKYYKFYKIEFADISLTYYVQIYSLGISEYYTQS